MVFGIDSGKVHCVFHDDNTESAGIGPNGEYNCFTCGAKAHDEIGFIAKYFGVGLKRAERIKNAFINAQRYRHGAHPLTDEQKQLLTSEGITGAAQDYFICSGKGKLVYQHKWSGLTIGTTWFNHPKLSSYNKGSSKYMYDRNIVAGLLSPLDDAIKYNTVIVTEGEKDMLTAKAKGINNVVTKIGGAKSYIIGGKPLEGKRVALIYDCDEYGRDGMEQDAQILATRFGCIVKIVDLQLQDKEDLNDYFIKYNKSVDDLHTLIKNTPVFVPKPEDPNERFNKILDSMSDNDLSTLYTLLQQRFNEPKNIKKLKEK